jgi:hypothetical protein
LAIIVDAESTNGKYKSADIGSIGDGNGSVFTEVPNNKPVKLV